MKTLDPVSLFHHFLHLPLAIRIALVCLSVAIFVSVLTWIVLIVIRWAGQRKEAWEKRNSLLLQEKIMDEVVLNKYLDNTPIEDIPLALDKFASWMGNRHKRQELLSKTMLQYQQYIYGKSRLLLYRLYQELGLSRNAEKRLRLRTPWRLTVALHELREMNVPVNEKLVRPLLRHKNHHVREATLSYFIRCATVPLGFLDEIRPPLLPWEQIELLRALIQRKDMILPDLSPYIHPDKPDSVVSFCLKTAVYFQQFSAIPSIEQLLGTPNDALRAEAINALGKLQAEDTETTLLKAYDTETAECKVQILKALGRIGSGNCLEFLKNQFYTAPTLELKKNAAKSIVNQLDMVGDKIPDLQAQKSTIHHLILSHVTNQYIKY